MKNNSIIIEKNNKKIDYIKFIDYYRKLIEKSELLCQEGNRKNSEGKFDSKLWIFFEEIDCNYMYMDFAIYEKLIKKKIITEREVSIIKCWLVEKLIDLEVSIETISRMFNSIYYFILQTDNFDVIKLNSEEGDIIGGLLLDKEKNTHVMYYIKKYIEFLFTNDILAEPQKIYFEELKNYSYKEYKEIGVRTLPKNKELLDFDYYLKKFFYEEQDADLLYYFYPILLWWKITNIIPMRPSEFTSKLQRDCLKVIDGKYYLKISRIKIIESNDAIPGRLPIIDKIEISEELYLLIEKYISITNFDSKTRTLLSYIAARHFKREYNTKVNATVLGSVRNKKINDVFTTRDLSRLINSFYRVVIENKYNYYIKNRVNPGDTRHLAFMSLLLQGVDPVTIAMLGGHTTLAAQDYYYVHTDYYIDSEIYKYINFSNFHKNDYDLKKIVFSKDVISPVILADCEKTSDKIGFCTVINNQNYKIDQCKEYCFLCKYWWCEPTEENYKDLKKYVLKNILGPIQKRIRENELLLQKLFKNMNPVNIEGIQIDNNDLNLIRKTRLDLLSDADNFVFHKKNFLGLGQ
jgi:hypothetical protein